jgi:hypothetical protein
VTTRDDRLGFVVTQCALRHHACFRLRRGIKIGARQMKALEQRMRAAALLMRRAGQRLQAFVERIVA